MTWNRWGDYSRFLTEEQLGRVCPAYRDQVFDIANRIKRIYWPSETLESELYILADEAINAARRNDEICPS